MAFLKLVSTKPLKMLKCNVKSCVVIGLVSLILQFFLFLLLLYTLEESETVTKLSNSCPFKLCEDIRRLTYLSKDCGINFIILDKDFLNSHRQQRRNVSTICYYCPLSRPLILGVDSVAVLDKKSQLLRRLIEEDFIPVTFYNRRPVQTTLELNQVEISLFLQRIAVFQIVILHPREDNTWWYGDIQSDPLHEAKLASLNLTLASIALQTSEGTIERFEVVSAEEEPHVMFPKNATNFLYEIDHSKFLECNMTRAQIFHSQFRYDKSAEAVRFRHKVWKMLSRVKTVLESVNIEFWLSSGTALGYFRECDIIAHSKDVDIGVWASAYSDKIIKEMQNHGFQLKISLGFPNDSLELSFIDQSGVKLDIFFFYEDEHSCWNGGTQVKSGKKFKYTFPKFTLCWTLFKDLRVRVPCETESYIQANYGPNWFTPVKSWDWKTSPFNVKPNGVWRTDELPKAVQLFA